MYYLKYIIAFHLLIGCYAADSELRVAQAFLDSRIVPNIEVTYPIVTVDLGNRIRPFETLVQPTVSYYEDEDQLYTLIFFGPDVPVDLIPRYTQFLHWLIVNVRGTDIATGDTVSSYFLPVPYPGGFYYSFLLYKQDDLIDPEPLKSLSFILNRSHFDPVKFKGQHNLIGPIAGDFMRQVYLPPISVSG